jgi:hypothetical protein
MEVRAVSSAFALRYFGPPRERPNMARRRLGQEHDCEETSLALVAKTRSSRFPGGAVRVNFTLGAVTRGGDRSCAVP